MGHLVDGCIWVMDAAWIDVERACILSCYLADSQRYAERTSERLRAASW